MSSNNNIAPTQKINTPAIVTTAGDVLAKNTDRNTWSIQNVGTNPVFILLGTGASTTVFHYLIKGGTADSDGLGGSVGEDGSGTVYSGIISIAGTTPKVVVRES